MQMGETCANPFNRSTLVGDILENWQSMLNVAADLLAVPAGLITRVDGPEIEVFLSSASQGNPYPEGLKTHYPDSGFYCEWVLKNRKPNIIPDARLDPIWQDNAAIKMNMVSYVGMPIQRPDGEMFGTICFLDCRKNAYNDKIVKLIDQFRKMIELSLKVVLANQQVAQRDLLFKGLSRIFPICSYCKKVRNDADEWVIVENYIKGISGRRASHAICPECFEREIQKEV
jgi:GAF domain-containing protein